MKIYSTRQAAQKLGISFPTLNRYIGDKKIPVPAVTELGTARVRVWTEQDIEHVRQLLPKIANGRKTRYKKQSAASSQGPAKTKKKTQARVPAPHKKK
jgi:predicted DNA-binding transcriptional regulator AlpA